MRLMRTLCICDNLLPPYVHTSGTKAIFQMYQALAQRGHEVHYLTSRGKWTSANWKKWAYQQKGRPEFFVVPDRFQLQRIAYLPYALKLHRRYGYDVIHEYSSSPLIANRSRVLRHLTGARVFHTVCTWNRPVFRSKRWNVIAPSELIETAPMPVDPRFFENTASPTTLSFLYLGLLNKNKGAGVFLDAVPEILAKHPHARGVIVTAPGRRESAKKNPYRKRVKALMERYPGRINFIEEEVDIAKLLPHIRVLVYPVETLFGTLVMPGVLVEAMASAKGIVATRLPELQGLLSENENALLFETREELVDKVGRLLRGDALCATLGAAARRSVETFRLDSVVDRLAEKYCDGVSDPEGEYAGEMP